jgi:hypothetical protein
MGLTKSFTMILVCNTPELRVFQIALSLAMIGVGGLGVRRAAEGKIRIRVRGASARGSNLTVGIVATYLFLLGVFLFLAALLGLDC